MPAKKNAEPAEPQRKPAPPTCVKWECQTKRPVLIGRRPGSRRWAYPPQALTFLRRGDALQTNNGFLICKAPGWYCPNCAAGYGGERDYYARPKRHQGRASD